MATSSDPTSSTEASSRCPKCGGGAIPKSVATHGPGKVIVRLRCESCGHEWTHERKAQALFDSTDD